MKVIDFIATIICVAWIGLFLLPGYVVGSAVYFLIEGYRFGREAADEFVNKLVEGARK